MEKDPEFTKLEIWWTFRLLGTYKDVFYRQNKILFKTNLNMFYFNPGQRRMFQYYTIK